MKSLLLLVSLLSLPLVAYATPPAEYAPAGEGYQSSWDAPSVEIVCFEFNLEEDFDIAFHRFSPNRGYHPVLVGFDIDLPIVPVTRHSAILQRPWIAYRMPCANYVFIENLHLTEHENSRLSLYRARDSL